MVTTAEFKTSYLPAAERFGHWCDLTSDSIVPNKLRSDHASDFRAALRLLDLGMVQISALTYPPLEISRHAKLIRQSDPEQYQLMLNLRGRHRIVQGGSDTTIGAGELTLYDTSRPLHGSAHADSGLVEGILVQFPRALLTLPADRVRPLTAERLSGRDGVGALLVGYLRQLVAGIGSYTAADGPRLATVTVDLLTALCAHHLDAERAMPPEGHRRVLFLRIHAFIEQHLADPGLTPAAVAAACQISLRQLHRLFREQDRTVAAWIRHRRLESCRRDLVDPTLSRRPIHATAARWGFTDPANFSRVFRTAYGVTPGDYRRTARTDTGHPSPATRH
ncbi:helix-turn-helix domain-containing protein [Streptomyces sp. NPDC056909]|uniref:AraC-like ligand-binding domain-containing protein n=1 Tax=Streptomyces sp. NPDC056909 TaxID=3345963 RepID=UPI0036A85DFF